MGQNSRKAVPAAAAKQQKKNKLSKGQKIAIIVSACVLLVGIVVGVTIANWDVYQQRAKERETVAVCNGYDIPYEELRFVTLLYKDHLKNVYGEHIWEDPATAEAHRAELEQLVMDNLCNNYIVLAACNQLGIDTDSKVMDDYVDTQIDSIGTRKQYREFLAENHMTDHYFRFALGVSFLESSIHYTLQDNDMYKYRMEDNAAEFKDYVETSGDYVRILHIYIENAEGEDPEKNLKRAQEISDELQAITDFDERRRRLGEYIGSVDNDDFLTVTGDGYYFTRGEMDEVYENAAFELAIGEVSEPVVCSGGNFIMMRLTPEREYIDKHVSDLMNTYHAVCLDNYIEQFRPDCSVELVEYGRSIDILTIE